MENKKAYAVPFKVRSVQTGTDITENIKLTAVESKGTSVPFFQANNNDTFTVTNADQEKDTLVDVVFKFDVNDQGKDYSLEAETKINVRAYGPGTFEVTYITNNGRFIGGVKGVQNYFDYQAKYQGVQLKGTEFKFLSEISGSYTPFLGRATFDKEENLPDGITNRVYYTPTLEVNTPNVEFRVIRVDSTKPTVGGDGFNITNLGMVFSPVANGYLQAIQPSNLDRYVTGSKGTRVRIYPIVFWNGNSIPLNTPNLKIEKIDITLQNQQGGRRLSMYTPTKDSIDFVIDSVAPPDQGKNLNFTLRFTYSGKDFDLTTVTVPKQESTFPTVSLTPVNELKPNLTQDAIFKGDPIDSTKWPWIYFNSSKAKFEKGTGVLRDVGTNVVLETISLDGLTPDQIGRYIQSIKTKGSHQTFTISGTLNCPRGVKGDVYGTNPVPVIPLVIDVPESGFISWVQPDVINNVGDNYLAISIQEEIEGVKIDLAARGDKFTVTGAATSVSQPASGTNGKLVVNVIGNGNNGEVLLTGDVYGPAPTNRLYKYSKLINAIPSDGVVITSSTVPVKVWDVLDTPPFIVKVDGVDQTNSIRNLKLIPNGNIIYDVDNPGKWVVDTAKTTGESVSTFFEFQVMVKGKWVDKVAYGIYQIDRWSGRVFEINDFDGLIGTSTAQDTSYAINPRYKGAPCADMVELASLGSVLGASAKLVSATPSDDNKTLVITLRGTRALAAPNKSNAPVTLTGMKYGIKGSDQTTENVDLITRNTDLGFMTADNLAIFGVGFCVSGPQYGIGEIRNNGRNGSTSVIYVYKNGVRVNLGDPDLYMYSVQGTGNNNNLVSWEWVGGSGTTGYGRMTRASLGTGVWDGYFNPIRGRLNSDPNKYSYNPQGTDSNFWAFPNPSSTVYETVLDTASTIIPGVRNKIKITLKCNNVKLTNPTTMTINVTSSPGDLMGTDYVLEKDPNDDSAYILDCMLGNAGGSILLRGVIKDPTVPGLLYLNATVPVPKAVLVPTVLNNKFNAQSGAETVIKFNLTMSDTPVLGATNVSPSISVGGSVGSAKEFKEIGGGVYSVTVVGAGTTGNGFATFNILANGVTQQIHLDPLIGEIDSSKFKLMFTPKTITGKKGDKVKLAASLTNDGTVVTVDNQGIDFTFKPPGVIRVNVREKDSVTFEILKEVPEDQTTDVEVTVKFQGMTTSDTITTTLIGVMAIDAPEQNVKVWDRSNNLPFTVKMNGEATVIPSGSYGFTETENVKLGSDTSIWMITANGAQEPKTQIVTFWFRLPTDANTVKRQVDVTFNIAKYDGREFVIKVNSPTAVRVNGLAGVSIVGTYRGLPISGNLGVTKDVIQQTALREETKSSAGRVTFDLRATSEVVYRGKQEYIISRGTGSVDGVDVTTASFELTSWSESKPLAIRSITPSTVDGKLGDKFPVDIELYYRGQLLPLNKESVTGPIYEPSGVIKTTDGSVIASGVTVEFIKDITENTLVNNVNVTFNYSGQTGAKNIEVIQHSTELKLTMGEGFQTTGSGDINNPLTLKQSVLKPE